MEREEVVAVAGIAAAVAEAEAAAGLFCAASAAPFPWKLLGSVRLRFISVYPPLPPVLPPPAAPSPPLLYPESGSGAQDGWVSTGEMSLALEKWTASQFPFFFPQFPFLSQEQSLISIPSMFLF